MSNLKTVNESINSIEEFDEAEGFNRSSSRNSILKVILSLFSKEIVCNFFHRCEKPIIVLHLTVMMEIQAKHELFVSLK